MQSILFASEPWEVIRRAILRKGSITRATKDEALACIEQANDFYTAATSTRMASARPLALYYSAMNLAKAYCLTYGSLSSFDQAQHGLSEQLPAGGKELRDAYLDAYRSPSIATATRPSKLQVFAELMKTYSGRVISTPERYRIPDLLPQVVVGHRLWAQAAARRERFIAVEELHFYHDKANKTIWLRLYFKHSDLTRLGVTKVGLLRDSELAATFKEVDSDKADHDCFEQKHPLVYVHYPSDQLLELVKPLRPLLWSTVGNTKPYRKHYVYVATAAVRRSVLPQLMSIYALTYYLGSITRYRPHHFDSMMDDSYGGQLQEFIMDQQSQFLYLMASEFALQDVSRASIV